MKSVLSNRGEITIKKRLTFICHNIQHLAKAQYLMSHLKQIYTWYEVNLIWNLCSDIYFEPFVVGYNRLFQFSNSPLYNKFIMPFTQEGHLFSLEKALAGYESNEIEEHFYIFSDDMFNTTKIFDCLDQIKNKIYSVTLLDEGLGLYDSKIGHYPFTLGRLYKQLAGVHIPKEMYIGWDPRVTRIIAQHPELLPEHKTKGRIIEQEPDIWGDTAFWHEWIGKQIELDNCYTGKKVLYLGTTDFYLKYEMPIIQELLLLFPQEQIIMKPHPRVSKEYRQSLSNRIQLVDDPFFSQLPAELLVSFIQPNYIISLGSSAVANIAECFPNIDALFLYDVFENGQSLSALLKQYADKFSNIICIHSFPELEEFIRQK